MHVEVRDALADAIIGGDERALCGHSQFDRRRKHAHVSEEGREQRIRQVRDCFKMRLGDHEAMAWKKRAMVEECNRVFILENAKAVVLANDFAECAVLIKDAELRVHE